MDGELLADQPLGQKLIKKGFWLYFFMIITAPVSYIIKVIVSNTLSVEDVGIFYSVYGLVILVSLYHDLGLTESLQYFVPKYRLEKKYNNCKTIIVLSLVIQLILGIGIAIIMYFSANRIAINHFHSASAIQIIRTFCFFFIGINIVQFFNSLYYSFQDVKRTGVIEFSRIYIILGFTLFFWLGKGLTLNNFSMVRMMGIGAAIITGAILFGKKYKKIFSQGKFVRDLYVFKKQLKYAFRVFISANARVVLVQIDQQLIINLLGPISAGYFTNYLSMIMAYNVVSTPILTLIFPIVSEIIAKKEHSKLELLLNTLYKYFSIFALSIGGLFVVLGPEIMTIFFGQKFLISGELLKYAGPFLIFNVLFVINFGVLAGTGKVKQRTGVLIIGLIVTVVSMVTFIEIFKRGLEGAILGTVIGWVILWILSFRRVYKIQRISFNRIFFIKNIAIIAIICIFIFLIKDQYFILKDTYRYSNLGYLTIIGIIYYLIISGINYPSIKLLKKEIKTLRK